MLTSGSSARVSRSFMPITLALCVACGLPAAVISVFDPGPSAWRTMFDTQEAQAMATNEQPADAARKQAENLPIRRITLYRSGVASFMRRGTIDGDSMVPLRFQTDQINDILKSMIVLDYGGGRIGGVSYGSKDPLTRRLASFGVDISDNPSLANLADRLRGSSATITSGDGPATGTILGVETRQEFKGDARMPSNVPFVNLLTTTGIRAINLNTISSFQLNDAALAAELNKALAALAEHRADRTKTVDVSFMGEGAREVAIAYVHETPVWKVSYRLVLPEDVKKDGGGAGAGGGTPGAGRKPDAPANAAGPQSTIQGWALVENTTDEDWSNVALSLVSGRPVSFVMDLYQPLYLARPEVPVPTVPGVAPRIYAMGTSGQWATASAPAFDLGEVLADGAARMEAGAPGAPPAPAMSAVGGLARGRADSREQKAGRPMSGADMSGYAAAAQAQAAESGEVFQYELSTPVTIQRQRSAMLPILSSNVGGRRVSIYNRNDGSEHPMRGVELINSTDLQLLPGPISVFDDGAYAGDAQIGHVAPGDKRLLAYAVDLDVAVVVRDDNTNTVNKIRIVDGAIEQTSTLRSEVTYVFTNKDRKRDREIVIEHSKRGEKLVTPTKADDETQGMYRFNVKADAGKAAEVKVVEDTPQWTRFDVLNYDLGTLIAYAKDGKTSDKVVEAVREAGRRRGLVMEQDRKIKELEKERQSIGQDQDRIRQNMNTIDRQSQLYTRYMQKLTDQETRVEKLDTDLAQARETLQKLQNDLAAFVRSLNME
jgi:hypothetical protein